ncbi:MAG: helix-turn-helix transcriptional regulator [Abitibacteriaceae bacterium]|nr:helix-turn-helix transcriptional regulator [Abditibacteriaceae bacterium]MBV9868135.1 helix-turn-helix transcriptional regulator [Abditibacteriaceae bacterium]
MQDLEQVAQLLRCARESRGLTVEQAATQSGVFYYTLIALEDGKISSPTPDMLLQLAQCYGLNFPHLLQLSGLLQRSSR